MKVGPDIFVPSRVEENAPVVRIEVLIIDEVPQLERLSLSIGEMVNWQSEIPFQYYCANEIEHAVNEYGCQCARGDVSLHR
jgi:hypothetical protein